MAKAALTASTVAVERIESTADPELTGCTEAVTEAVTGTSTRSVETDRLYGGEGPDRIVARFFDHVYAGPGNDTIIVLHSPPGSMDPDVPIRCGPGNDLVITAEGWPSWFFEPYGCERLKRYPHPD